MMDAIVLDGDQRSALAVTRSLGSKGITVAVGAETERSLSSCSRYASDRFCYPSPYQDPEGFFTAIRDYTASHRDAVLFPMTDVTLGEILGRRYELEETIKFPFVDFERYAVASDKASLVALAERLGVPVPRTIPLTQIVDIDGIIAEAEEFGYPVVIKPGMSRVRTTDGWTRERVRYAESRDALRRELEKSDFCGNILLQERIEGPGIGIFVLLHEGELVAKFAHKRIREKPPSGGVSVLCEGIEPPAEALNSATELLEKLNWTGVAMVEFKFDERDHKFKLMEINCRFWGSLQLAITSGVDFPFLLFQLASGGGIDRRTQYKTGVRLRWELGDFDHLFLRLMKRPSELSLPAHAPSTARVLRDFAAAFVDPTVYHEVLRWDDPRPFLFEARRYLSELF